jgi:2-polyprenyl-3-methyl-5-hydroxy-6-metoxy-1,4-benzoquinol methylase
VVHRENVMGLEVEDRVWSALQRVAAECSDQTRADWVLGRIKAGKSYEVVIDSILQRLERCGLPMTVLDIGTSEGTVPLALSSYGVTCFACDHPTRGVPVHVLRSSGIRYAECSLVDGEIPYRDGVFDVVVFKDVIEHLPFSPRRVLESIHRTLKPGGHVVIWTPNIARVSMRLKLLAGRSVHPPLDYWFNTDGPFFGHHREYTLSEVRTMLEWTSFSVIRANRIQMQDQTLLLKELRRERSFGSSNRSLTTICVLMLWNVLASPMPVLAQASFVVGRKEG